jgi:hypothetical protein
MSAFLDKVPVAKTAQSHLRIQLYTCTGALSSMPILSAYIQAPIACQFIIQGDVYMDKVTVIYEQPPEELEAPVETTSDVALGQNTSPITNREQVHNAATTARTNHGFSYMLKMLYDTAAARYMDRPQSQSLLTGPFRSSYDHHGSIST